MKYAYIGRETAKSLSQIYDVLAQSLAFPEWFGKNLDALYDCLTDLSEPSYIVVADTDYYKGQLSEKFGALLDCLADAEKNNPNVYVRIV